MSAYVKAAAAWLAVVAALYLFFSFVALSFNPREWAEVGRVLFAFFAVCAGVAVPFLISTGVFSERN